MHRHRSVPQGIGPVRDDSGMRRPRVAVSDDTTVIHSDPGGDTLTTKRNLTRWAGLLAASAIIFGACSTSSRVDRPVGCVRGTARRRSAAASRERRRVRRPLDQSVGRS